MSVKLTLLNAGFCTNPEHIVIRGGRWQHIPLPAMFALIEHPRFGIVLYDTGYAQRFFDVTRRYPNKLYAQITPIHLREDEIAVCQLEARGIRPQDVERIFISHFHADHVAALADFPRAAYVHMPHAFDAVRNLRGLRALSKAYLPDLIPSDFESRQSPVDLAHPINLPPEYAPFTRGYDLLGDQSVIAVELPGHAVGQMGLFIRTTDAATTFLVGDACWLKRAYQENRPPHPFANLLFADPAAYRATLSSLHTFHQSHPSVRIVPSHCAESIAQYG